MRAPLFTVVLAQTSYIWQWQSDLRIQCTPAGAFGANRCQQVCPQTVGASLAPKEGHGPDAPPPLATPLVQAPSPHMGRLAVTLEQGESSSALVLMDMVLNPQPTNHGGEIGHLVVSR